MFVFIKGAEENAPQIVNTKQIVCVWSDYVGSDMWRPVLTLANEDYIEISFLKQDSSEKALRAWLEYVAQNKVEM